MTSSEKLFPKGHQPIPIRDEQSGLPQIIPYLTENPEDHDSVLIIPGGGYNHVSLEKEGEKIAISFNQEKLNALILNYRVAPYTGKEILADAEQAFQWAKQQFGSRRIAMMGFSAGGHLTLTETIYGDSGRPDALILCYPVVTFKDPLAHRGSRENFLGKDEAENPLLIEKYSAEDHIAAGFPPVFLWHCEDDASVPVENSKMLSEALEHAGIDHKTVIYQGGAHGMGLALDHPVIRGWFGTCMAWLRGQGFA